MRSGLFLSAIVLFGCSPQPKQDDVAKLSKQLPDLVAKYRTAGLPWVASDVRTVPSDPKDDAGPLLRKAHELLMSTNVNFVAVKNLADDGRSQEAAKLLAPDESAIALAVQASQKPILDFKTDPDLGYMGLPNFRIGASVKAFSRLLAYKAEIAAKDGHPDKAAADLSAGFRLAELMSQEHDVIGGLVRIASDYILLSGAQSCQAFLANDLNGLKTLQTALSKVPTRVSFADAMRGEAYMQIAFCRNTLGLEPGDLGSFDPDSKNPGINEQQRKRLLRTGMPEEAGQQATMAEFLKVWVAAIPALAADDPEQITTAIDKAVAEEDDPKAKSDIGESLEFDLAGKAFKSDGAAVLVTQALGEALIYKSEHGNWPTSIDQVPGKWIDPFSGKPLLLTFKKGDIRIYSIGRDKVDHGGTAKSEIPQAKLDAGAGYDIVAAYPPIKSWLP